VDRCGPKQGSSFGRSFKPLYYELGPAYVVVSKGYQCVNGVLERMLTRLGVTIGWTNTHVTHWYSTVSLETCLEGSRSYGPHTSGHTPVAPNSP
jgi:hypothetical protein